MVLPLPHLPRTQKRDSAVFSRIFLVPPSPSLAKCVKCGLLPFLPPSRAKVSRGWIFSTFRCRFRVFHLPRMQQRARGGFYTCFNAVSATSPACNSEPEVVFIWRFDTVRATTTTPVDNMSMPMTCHITQ